MLSPSFLRSPWYFLQVVAFIAITSNSSSNSKELSKYPNVFKTEPSNWRNSKLLFRKVSFLMRSQKFLRISVNSLLISICIFKSKLLILTFSIMSFFSCPIFFNILVFVFFTEKTFIGFVFFNSFNVFLFEFVYYLEMFFKQYIQVFPNAGHFMFPSTIQTFFSSF